MALVQPDFTEVTEAVGPGTYKGIIKKADVKTWEKSGTQYIDWTLETVGDTNPRNNGRRISHKTPVSGKGAFQLQNLYRAATGQTLKGSFDTDMLMGKQVEVELVDGVNRVTGQPTGYVEVKQVRSVTGN